MLAYSFRLSQSFKISVLTLPCPISYMPTLFMVSVHLIGIFSLFIPKDLKA